MKNIISSLFLLLICISCKTLGTDGEVSPQDKRPVPETGIYYSYDTYIVPDSYKYSYKTYQWEWKFGDVKLELTPSAFGRLQFKENGTYEFIDFKKTGTYKLDNKTKKIAFTGYMAGLDGYFYVKRGWCTMVIAGKSADGQVLSVRYEKKSDFPQPDVKNPNGDLKGTIVNMLSKGSADYIDVASAKTIKTHSTFSGPVTGISKYSVSIYKENLDIEGVYPAIEIKDESGNMIKRFKNSTRDENRWDIGQYWYGMLSPDGSKLALVGKYKKYLSFLDTRSYNDYPMIGIIDVNTGKQIYSYELDNNGSNWGPGWAPTGELVMPRKGGGINILDANLKNIKTIYTKNVSDARMNQFGKVLFNEGTGIFTMDANGSNIAPVKDGNTNLSFTKLFDLGWSPDGKAMAFVVNDFILDYNIILLKPNESSFYFSDAKGDEFRFSSPFLSWK